MEVGSPFEKLRVQLASPPLFTTVRVNTLVATAAEIRDDLQRCVKEQYAEREETAPTVELHPDLPDMLVIPGRGPIQRKRHEKWVIVDHHCGCAVLRGANVFVSGVLAAPASVNKGDAVSVYADLDGRCLMGRTAPYEGRTVHVGNGLAMYSRAQIFASSSKPSGIGISMTQPTYDAPSLSGVLQQRVFAQNLPSAVVAHVLDPQPGELILDMCAAPGGKTTHVATLMKNQGRLIALDKSVGKVRKIKENCAAWELTCVEAYLRDSSRCLDEQADIAGEPPYPPGRFDRVLLDGPCSALGQRPVLVNNMTAKHLASHPPLQRAIFSEAVRALKKGGCLVYSTCTLPTNENEEIVAWALKTYPELQLVKQTPHLGGTGILVDGLTAEHTSLLQRFGPASELDMINDITQETMLSMFKGAYEIMPSQKSSNNSVNLPRSNESLKTHGLESEGQREEVIVNNGKERSVFQGSVSNGQRTVNSDTIGFFIAKFIKL